MKKLILIMLLIVNSKAFTQNNIATFNFPNYKLEIYNYQIKSYNTYKNTDNLISFEIKISRNNNLPVNIANDFKNYASNKLTFYYISEIFYDSTAKLINEGVAVFRFKELGKNFTLFGTKQNLNGLKSRNSDKFAKEVSLVNTLYEYNSEAQSLSKRASKKIKKLKESDYINNKYLDTLLIKEVLLVYKEELNGEVPEAIQRYDLLTNKYESSNSELASYFKNIMKTSEASKSFHANIENYTENIIKYFNEDRFDDCINTCREFFDLTKDYKGHVDVLDKIGEIKYMYAYSLYMVNKGSPHSYDINDAAQIFIEFSQNENSIYFLKATLILGNIYNLKEDLQKAIKCYTTIISKASPEDEIYKNAFDNLKIITDD